MRCISRQCASSDFSGYPRIGIFWRHDSAYDDSVCLPVIYEARSLTVGTGKQGDCRKLRCQQYGLHNDGGKLYESDVGQCLTV